MTHDYAKRCGRAAHRRSDRATVRSFPRGVPDLRLHRRKSTAGIQRGAGAFCGYAPGSRFGFSRRPGSGLCQSGRALRCRTAGGARPGSWCGGGEGTRGCDRSGGRGTSRTRRRVMSSAAGEVRLLPRCEIAPGYPSIRQTGPSWLAAVRPAV